ncbi:MAG: MFS transporter, partial [Paludibacteraceae bacterium]|nr:MFS transporter [Paludibacteraceae bacterium]
MANNKSSNILPIAVMFLLFFMIAFVTNFAGSMGVIVKNQFGASNAMSQLGTLANFIAYACMGIPAGLILKRKGYKFTSLLAVTIGFIGVGVQWLSGYAQSFGVYVAGAFIAGFSMCLLNIVVNPMLNTLGGGGNRGNQLIQFGGSCNSIGGTLAPILLGYLIGGQAETAQVGDAAPAMIAAMAIFALAFVVVALSKIPEPHIETAEQRAAAKAVKDPHSPLSFRHFVLGAIGIFFYVGIEVGIPNTANLYMSGMESVGPALAGTIVGFYWLCMMFGRLLGGVVGGKVSSRAMLTIVCSLAIALLLCVMFFPETW